MVGVRKCFTMCAWLTLTLMNSQLPNVETELRAKRRELADLDRDLANRMQV